MGGLVCVCGSDGGACLGWLEDNTPAQILPALAGDGGSESGLPAARYLGKSEIRCVPRDQKML